MYNGKEQVDYRSLIISVLSTRHANNGVTPITYSEV